MSYTNGLDKPTDYFITKLYSGNGSTQNITGLDFQPDWVWIKERTSTSDNMLFDAVRGATNRLESNTTDSEASSATQLNAFNSDGWTTGSSAGTNESGQTYASWNWLASNTTASNTDGSITSTVSANTTSGFSIVSYTGNGSAGATIGHSLGSVPSLMIVKRRSNTEDWRIYHKTLGATKYLNFNTNASASATNRWNDTEPTSSVFSIGDHASVNFSGDDYVAYLFAEKKGFSKFGSYTGNGSTDGTFVYTGFKPAFVILKHTDATGNNWRMFDNKRDVDNIVEKPLYPSVNNAEATGDSLDFLSNGFKLRTTSNAKNDGSYIYMCFAESPFVTSTGIPTTAR